MSTRYRPQQLPLSQTVSPASTQQARRLDEPRTLLSSRWEAHSSSAFEDSQGDPDWDIKGHPLENDPLFSELSKYLRDGSTPRAQSAASGSSPAHLSALVASDVKAAVDWWRLNEHKYPTLFEMWRDYAHFQPTTVLVERGFSVMRDRVRDKRANLSSDSVEAEMCLLDWLRGECKEGHPLHGWSNQQLMEMAKDGE